MGQVYQATDTKLNRQVALKILPEAFATDPDRLARFQREAQVLASLNHPNIAQIHGIEESDGTRALVLELVEGPTLADRIAKGPIPLDEALPIAKQIAEALEAAHEAGVIHRDLKPANIKVRDDGTVKVLDFGLAKALDTTPEGDPSQSPTLTAAATQMGVILGTAAYMSPEQAKGKTADRRSDVWAFGAVLYEILSGRRAFIGEDVSDTLVSVFRDDPDWTRLSDDVPARVRQAIRVCLQKDPKQRVRDVAAVRLAMEGAFETTVDAPTEGVETARSAVWQRPIPAALMALAIASVAGLAGWTAARPETEPADVIRFTITPTETAQFRFAALSEDLAISPDGTRIAYQSLSLGGSATSTFNVPWNRARRSGGRRPGDRYTCGRSTSSWVGPFGARRVVARSSRPTANGSGSSTTATRPSRRSRSWAGRRWPWPSRPAPFWAPAGERTTRSCSPHRATVCSVSREAAASWNS